MHPASLSDSVRRFPAGKMACQQRAIPNIAGGCFLRSAEFSQVLVLKRIYAISEEFVRVLLPATAHGRTDACGRRVDTISNQFTAWMTKGAEAETHSLHGR